MLRSSRSGSNNDIVPPVDARQHTTDVLKINDGRTSDSISTNILAEHDVEGQSHELHNRQAISIPNKDLLRLENLRNCGIIWGRIAHIFHLLTSLMLIILLLAYLFFSQQVYR